MKHLIISLSVLLSISCAAQKIKVACVGNSVTYGTGISDREHFAYPVQLQQLLGKSYEVRNFGKPGATLLVKAFRPYVAQEEFRNALHFAADLVVIHLGLNDTDPRAWPNYRDDFIPNYRALIDSFKVANPKAKIWICEMTPIGHRHARFRSGTRDWHAQIQEAIEQIATSTGLPLLDFYTPLHRRPDLFPDALHPNAEGAGILARTVYGAITGDYGGLRMPEIYSDSMVLQRDSALTLRGQADAGAPIRVSIAGQTLRATANDRGIWQVTLRPLKAGGPYKLAISSKKQKIEYNGVLAGEVWLCSGQSNMAFMVKQSATAREDITNATSQHHVRLYHQKPRWETNAIQWDSTALAALNRLEHYQPTCWTGCNAQSVANFSAIAYRFGVALADSLKVPVGLICNAVGGSTTESWIDRHTLEFEFPDMLTNWLHNDHIMDWARERAALNIKKATHPLQRHPYEPCYLYEAGILPLESYTLKGVVWYQGESNAHNIELHERLFPMLVNSWRTHLGTPKMPFLLVQLSSIDRPSWCWFRDSQRRMANTLEKVYMAVSSDLGDSLNVHPTQKREIGERLTRLALCQVYGHKDLVPAGPQIRDAQRSLSGISLYFDNAKGLHTSDHKELRTFEVAGIEGIFYPAKASIKNNRVYVETPKEIQEPLELRYGWQPFTRANLVNEAGLPTSTFRFRIN
ncbi:MAG: GDSL-type esterase/lipase family protein [Bacteroidaceae bacterium]